jgi:TolA-binding protein
MSDDRNLLDQVARALRERHDGREPADAHTRERILSTVRKQNKRRKWWIKGSIPGGMLLLGTTAWAQATHQWPAVWRTIGDVLSLPLSTEGNSEQQLAVAHSNSAPPGKARSGVPASSLQAKNPSDVSSADAGVLDTATTDPAVPEVSSAESNARLANEQPSIAAVAAVARRKRPTAIEQPEPPAEPRPAPELEPTQPPSEPEIAAFRAANDLDLKQRNLAGALSAYRLYARDYPTGRFVPEARYNAAIILVKLGKRDEARRELTPFASGKYGAHRQARAAKLLEALEQSAPQDNNSKP